MSEYMHLVGAEDVRAAAVEMRQAASEMNRAAANVEGALERHERFLNDWLSRFQDALATITSGRTNAEGT